MPTTFDRSELATAREVIESVFERIPGGAKESYIDFLASAIEYLSSRHADRWGVTLFPWGVRLNVGLVECLVLRSGALRILIEEDSAPTGTKFVGRAYASAPGCHMTALSLSDLPQLAATFAESHYAALSIAARRPVSRAIMDAHSGGVTAFLSEALHRRIPNPSYPVSVVEDLKTHQQIQTWRNVHPDGFLINLQSANSGMLHRVECAHFGDYRWTAASGQGLASQMKICSLNLQDLTGWAKDNGISDLAKCTSCRPAENVDLVREVAANADLSQFEPENLADARQRIIASIVQRQGQPVFRSKLLKLYGSRCSFSGCAVVEVLEAAHIHPYQGPLTNHPQNGLLLRSDLHSLFDLGLLAVDTKTMTIVTHTNLDNSLYADLLGCPVHIPAVRSLRPSIIALDQHREKAGLTLRPPYPKPHKPRS